MIFNTVKECLQYLFTKVKSLEPIDSAYIKWSKTNQGMQAVLVQDTLTGGNNLSPKTIIPVEDEPEDARPFFATYNLETKMIDITGGWVIANGEFFTVPDASVGVADGYICVKSEIPENEKEFVAPFFVYGTPSLTCRPIAKVTINDEQIDIVNYYVSTAVLMETIEHPPCDCMR